MNNQNAFDASSNNIPANIEAMNPKVINLRGSQLNPYQPYLNKMNMKKKLNSKSLKNKNNFSEDESEEDKKSHNLTKELEKQIHELQKLTKEAKEVNFFLHF